VVQAGSASEADIAEFRNVSVGSDFEGLGMNEEDMQLLKSDHVTIAMLRQRLAYAAALVLIIIVFCHATLGWNFVDCIYFTVVTFTTVGFGDFTPLEEGQYGKLAFVIIIFIGVELIGNTLILLSEFTFQEYHKKVNNDAHIIAVEAMAPAERARLHNFEIQKLVAMNVGLMLSGAVFVRFNEGWSMIDSLYWSVVTSTTVGYGDLTIEKESSRVFVSGFILLCVTSYTISLSKIMEMAGDSYHMKVRAALKEVPVQEQLLKRMDIDGSGR
jgi:voltage-gated potassium channel Kch